MAKSRQPALLAFVVSNPKDGSDRKSIWREVGAAFSHRSGRGFDLLITDGIALSGRVVLIEPREKPAPGRPAEEQA